MADQLRGRVLVVEDDPVNRLLLRRRLEHEGLEVRVAEDGVTALEVLRCDPVDLVLLDIVMPRLDGYGVLAALREDPDLAWLPVVVISASEGDDAVLRCIDLGADDVLTKPFDPALLRARIGAGLARTTLHRLDQQYRQRVDRVVAAARAVESGAFDAASLDDVAAGDDAVAVLARVFARMAVQVRERERALRREVGELRVEIDRVRAARRADEITQTDYFTSLVARAADLRSDPGKAT